MFGLDVVSRQSPDRILQMVGVAGLTVTGRGVPRRQIPSAALLEAPLTEGWFPDDLPLERGVDEKPSVNIVAL